VGKEEEVTRVRFVASDGWWSTGGQPAGGVQAAVRLGSGGAPVWEGGGWCWAAWEAVWSCWTAAGPATRAREGEKLAVWS
jgi:hypothetical protein